MPASDIALVARARGVATHLVSRSTLETLAEADDPAALARRLTRLGATIDPIGEPADVFHIERAVRRTAHRHLRTLTRWQERRSGALDVFAADQDRRSLRALLRGAVQGAPAEARLEGLLPTPTLPQRALTELARQPSAADVVNQLVLLAHPDGLRLRPLVAQTRPDLLAIEVELVRSFAERATRAAVRDRVLRDFVRVRVDAANAQNALIIAGEPRDIDPAGLYVPGGRWLPAKSFAAAAEAGSPERALTVLVTTFDDTPLSSMLSGPVDVGHVEFTFFASTLAWLTRAARLEPLSTATLLRVLLSIEAQSRDLRSLAWGAALGLPPSIRRQHLLTPR